MCYFISNLSLFLLEAFHTHSQQVLLTWSTRKPRHSHSQQCLSKGCLCTDRLPVDACIAHWWALTFFSSINVTWVFVTLMVNYQYWHCDDIWLHLRWKFKNKPKKEDVWFLWCIFLRWNSAFETSGLSWSQCLAVFFLFFFLSELLVHEWEPRKMKLLFHPLDRNSSLPHLPGITTAAEVAKLLIPLGRQSPKYWFSQHFDNSPPAAEHTPHKHGGRQSCSTILDHSWAQKPRWSCRLPRLA